MENSTVKSPQISITKYTFIEISGDSLMSFEITLICQWIIFSIVSQTIDLFGIGGNIINIICFVKQGFNESVNVSLLGLALADLGCLSTLLWTNICYTPAFSALDLPFDTIEFQYLTSGMPHLTFTRITGWITAIVTLERCLCVTMPMKVRHMITPKRVFLLIVCVFIALIASVSPLYVVNRLERKFYPRLNKSRIGIVSSSNREQIEQISFGINNVFINFSAFIVTNICTVILVYKLQERAQWRNATTASAQADIVSQRSKKAAKMVVMISSLFIACFVPNSITFIAMIVEPELSVSGKYKNILIVTGGLGFALESVNSSFNIIIYYRMSSKYRSHFRQLFRLNTETNNGSIKIAN